MDEDVLREPEQSEGDRASVVQLGAPAAGPTTGACRAGDRLWRAGVEPASAATVWGRWTSTGEL